MGAKLVERFLRRGGAPDRQDRSACATGAGLDRRGARGGLRLSDYMRSAASRPGERRGQVLRCRGPGGRARGVEGESRVAGPWGLVRGLFSLWDPWAPFSPPPGALGGFVFRGVGGGVHPPTVVGSLGRSLSPRLGLGRLVFSCWGPVRSAAVAGRSAGLADSSWGRPRSYRSFWPKSFGAST